MKQDLIMQDHGLYKKDQDGNIILFSLDEGIRSGEYHIKEGTAAIARDAFFDLPFLKTIYIPASLKTIPDGCLSNTGSWASEESGITRVNIAPGNSAFTVMDGFFCSRKDDGTFHLIRALDIPENAVIPEEITSAGEGCFSGRKVKSVRIENLGYPSGSDTGSPAKTTIWFPYSHRFYLEILLDNFGKNGKLFSFREYDKQLLFDHFNPERIRMLCARLTDPVDMEEGFYEKIRQNALAHMEDVMEAVLKDGDTDLLELLAENGLFTEENISELTDQTGRSMRKDLMFWMMEYKNSHFGVTEEELFI